MNDHNNLYKENLFIINTINIYSYYRVDNFILIFLHQRFYKLLLQLN